jgi:hypothetical protein
VQTTKSGANAPIEDEAAYAPGFGQADDGLLSMLPRDSPSAEDSDNSSVHRLKSFTKRVPKKVDSPR